MDYTPAAYATLLKTGRPMKICELNRNGMEVFHKRRKRP